MDPLSQLGPKPAGVCEEPHYPSGDAGVGRKYCASGEGKCHGRPSTPRSQKMKRGHGRVRDSSQGGRGVAALPGVSVSHFLWGWWWYKGINYPPVSPFCFEKKIPKINQGSRALTQGAHPGRLRFPAGSCVACCAARLLPPGFPVDSPSSACGIRSQRPPGRTRQIPPDAR